MLTVGVRLKVLYPKMIHLTCLIHALHRVAEVARIKSPDVNDLIASVKQIFVKSPSRRQFFTAKTSIPLPPKPVITRWGELDIKQPILRK